jgi:Bax protein
MFAASSSLAARSYISLDPTAPDFSEYKDVNERKNAFFDFLYPMIMEQNKVIQHQRQLIKSVGANQSICDKYRVDCSLPSAQETLLSKVNIIPPSLVMAQAAIESAWGQSRFSKEANNFFGVWCWTPNCGIAPLERPDGETYSVKKYESVRKSINDYMLNLNRHDSYTDFRKIRAGTFNSLDLADTLVLYSQEREEYTAKVKATISFNELTRFD